MGYPSTISGPAMTDDEFWASEHELMRLKAVLANPSLLVMKIEALEARVLELEKDNGRRGSDCRPD